MGPAGSDVSLDNLDGRMNAREFFHQPANIFLTVFNRPCFAVAAIYFSHAKEKRLLQDCTGAAEWIEQNILRPSLTDVEHHLGDLWRKHATLRIGGGPTKVPDRIALVILHTQGYAKGD